MLEIEIHDRALDLALRLKEERKAKDLTIAEVAQRAAINPRTYSHFEQTGEISLARLIRAFDVLGRAEEIEKLVRPSTTFSSLDEMERRLSPQR